MDAGDRIWWKIASSSDSLVGIASVVVVMIVGGAGWQNEWLGGGCWEEVRLGLTCDTKIYENESWLLAIWLQD